MVESSLLEILGVNFSSGSQTIINAVDLNLCIFCSPSWPMSEFPSLLKHCITQAEAQKLVLEHWNPQVKLALEIKLGLPHRGMHL